MFEGVRWSHRRCNVSAASSRSLANSTWRSICAWCVSEEQAAELAEQFDTFVLAEDEVSIVDLVEDDLLLGAADAGVQGVRCVPESTGIGVSRRRWRGIG